MFSFFFFEEWPFKAVYYVTLPKKLLYKFVHVFIFVLLLTVVLIIFCVKDVLDRSRPTMHSKFDLTGVRTHDQPIMTVHFMS